MKVISLIPARSGSVRVKNKNIYPLGGYPIVAWSIVASRLSNCVEETYVMTDSEEYAEIARQYGAKVVPEAPGEPGMGDYRFVSHFLKTHKTDYLVFLRPTTPLRNPQDIYWALEKIKRYPEATSLRSAHPLSDPYQKMFMLLYIYYYWIPLSDKTEEIRQKIPITYRPDGYIDIILPSKVKDGVVFGDRIVPWVTDRDPGDIDTIEDLEYIEWRLQRYGSGIWEYLKKEYPKVLLPDMK